MYNCVVLLQYTVSLEKSVKSPHSGSTYTFRMVRAQPEAHMCFAQCLHNGKQCHLHAA
jgi:hypothetical protein